MKESRSAHTMQSSVSGAVLVRPGQPAGFRRFGVQRRDFAPSPTTCTYPAQRHASSSSKPHDTAALSRRDTLLLSGVVVSIGWMPAPALAARGRIKPPPSDQFLTLPVRTTGWRGAETRAMCGLCWELFLQAL